MTERQGGICIQCALRVFVEELEKGLDPMVGERRRVGYFEGEPEAHMQAEHPDTAATRAERDDLERRAYEGFEALARRKAAAAKNN